MQIQICRTHYFVRINLKVSELNVINEGKWKCIIIHFQA